MPKKNTLSMLISLCSQVDKLSSNIIIYPQDNVHPPVGSELKFHIQVGWELKVFLEPCPDTVFLNCEYPCVILYPPLVKHPTSPKLSNSSCICIGDFQNDFTIICSNEIAFSSGEKFKCLCEESNFNSLKRVEELYATVKEQGSSDSKRYFIQSHLLSIFSFSIKVLEHFNKQNETPQTLVDKAIIYIKKTYHERNLSVSSVAQHLGVTRNYMANLFKKHNMPTVQKYIVNIRLNEARKLLEKSIFSIKEVAFLTGWENQFYFSNSFYKKYKVRPSRLLLKKL